MSKQHNMDVRIDILDNDPNCAGGECQHFENGICTCESSHNYGKRVARRCDNFMADSPYRNIKIVKGQSCGSCRYYCGYRCSCWKSFSLDKAFKSSDEGKSCRNWEPNLAWKRNRQGEKDE